MGKREIEKRYCYICGREVAIGERTYGYDEKTGKPLIAETRTCLNNMNLWRKHPVTEQEAASRAMSW